MRALAATAIAVGLAAVAGGAEAREASIYRGACGEVVLPSGPTGLDAAIRIDTSCGTFIADNSRVRFVGALANGANAGAGQAINIVREQPLGWTRAGLRFTSAAGVVTFRTRPGRTSMRLRTARDLFWFDAGSGTLLLVTPDEELIRTDGRNTQSLGAVSSLGLSHWSEIQPLPSGRIALLGRGLVILDPDGAVVAADSRRRGGLPTESPSGAVAIISPANPGNYYAARESVRLLRPGDRSSTPLFVNDYTPLGCGRSPSLAWRGKTLLYSTPEGKVVAIDIGSGERVDLTEVVARLPGDFISAAWI
jgi:hypothetical protein